MKLKKRNNKNSLVGDNSFLPLVNIIFLLLIFFLLAGVIEKRRDLHDVKLPEATLEQFSESDQPELHVYPNGRVRVGVTNIKIKDLSKSLKNEYPDLKDSELLVTADAGVTSDHLNQILLILNKTQVKKISLLTLKNE